MTEPGINAEATARLVVSDDDLASALASPESDPFPPVLATSRMIALMELASARVLSAHLQRGELSVGVAIEVSHTAPTPPGVTVTATARCLGREGKLFLFEVVACDPGGEIGRGSHKRAVITTERLLEGAQRRTGTT